MNTPPKDNSFLADIGLPYYVVALWNKAMGYYVYADLQVDLYNGEWDDTYFQTDHFDENELKSWIELPEIKGADA